MRTRHKERTDRIERSVAARPIRTDVLDTAFDRFCETGELPEDQRLAAEVVQRTLRDKEESPEIVASTPLIDSVEELRALAKMLREAAQGSSEPVRRPVREYLFDEAVYGEGTVRQAARAVLMWEVGRGADVTDPDFLADRTLPEYGSLGLHLIGFPSCLARPPHVRQARRLFARLEDLRARINHDDPDWFEPIGAAIREFRERGDLSDDETAREFVLVDGELLGLMANYLGQGDADVIAAFDAAARATGAARTDAVAQVQELVRAGRLLPADA